MTARSALATLAALITLVVLGAGSAAQGSASSGPATALSNDVVQNLSLATFNGTVPSAQTVTVGIYLANPRQSAEDAYVAKLYNPSSASYRKFLTPAAFNARFGVPAANFDAPPSRGLRARASR